MTPKEKYVAFTTLLCKEVVRFTRIWMQTILPSSITMSLYFTIFGGLIGSQLRDIEGYNYMEYIVPGILLMAVMNNAYSNVVSSFYSAKFQRHIEELLISSMPNYLILLGFVAGGVARGMLVGGVVFLVAMFFVDITIFNVFICFAVVFLTTALFSLAGFINAIYAKTFDDISIIPTFVLTPLIYLGGVFYSIDMLPEFWQHVSLLNPVLYMINAFRYGMLGISDINVNNALVMIVLFVVALFIYSIYLLNKGIGLKQ